MIKQEGRTYFTALGAHVATPSISSRSPKTWRNQKALRNTQVPSRLSSGRLERSSRKFSRR